MKLLNSGRWPCAAGHWRTDQGFTAQVPGPSCLSHPLPQITRRAIWPSRAM